MYRQQQQQQQQQRSYPQLAAQIQAAQKKSVKDMESAIATLVRSCRPRTASIAASHQKSMELEVRFGVTDAEIEDAGAQALLKPGAAFTQTDYERVATTALQHGWSSADKTGDAMLRITPMMGGGAPVRAEIHGTPAIEAYCRRNSLDSVLEHHAVSAAQQYQETIYFTRKQNMLPVSVAFPDLEFRVALSQETRLSVDNAEVRQIREAWPTLPKFFRHMNRVRFQAPNNCVALDLSIVHSNRRTNEEVSGAVVAGATRKARPVMGVNTGEVGLFGGYSSHVEYEIELEVDYPLVTQWLLEEAKKSSSSSSSSSAGDVMLSEPERKIAQLINGQLHRAIRMVMVALQGSNYPVGRLERNAVLAEYMNTLYSSARSPFFVGPNPVTLQQHHCLPASPSQVSSGIAAISILDNYCVTDKADGSRALLFVSGGEDRGGKSEEAAGGVYMITGSLQVQYTGMRCTDRACWHLILDGEYITRGHGQKPLNLFAAFDLYAAGDQVLMGLPFADVRYGDSGSLTMAERSANELALAPYRLPQMQHYIARLSAGLGSKFMSAKGDAVCHMTVRAKDFYLGSSMADDPFAVSIFAQANTVLERSSVLEYETDGMIFTPTDTAVNGDKPVFQRPSSSSSSSSPNAEQISAALTAFKLPNYTITWFRTFKWKPPDQNTIDFLVSVASATTQYVTLPGNAAPTAYKKLKLLCGYNAKHADIRGPSDELERHRKLRPQEPNDAYSAKLRLLEAAVSRAAASNTPMYNMLMDVAPSAPVTEEDRNGLDKLSASLAAGAGKYYKPRAFVPSTPYDMDAQYCCVKIGDDGMMRADNGDLIENATIVELSFDRDAASAAGSTSWGWRANKVRQDKTSKLRSGMAEFGNPYTTANDNWKSIHYPVTREMITGVVSSADADSLADAVYYNSARDTSIEQSDTRCLRDFHNRVVKKSLLQRVVRFTGARTLIDFAVGKAGDLHKWSECGLQFVLGLDISRDNIFNADDGAIARAQRRFYEGSAAPLPRCIFLPADSSMNIRSKGEAFEVTQDRGGHQIVRALFGDQRAPPQTLSPRFEGIVGGGGEGGGFQVGSCQFAEHYFWKSPDSLHGHLRNLAECIQQNGLFIGTCYDGAKIFRLLKEYPYAGAGAMSGAKVTGTQQAPYFTLRSGGGGKTLLSIAKKYSARVFEHGPQSVGMTISVFMESIDQALDEYLVHFSYMDELMNSYGFELVAEEEMVGMGFASTGEGGRRPFKSVWDTEPHNEKKDRDAWKMTTEDREISFLNSLFVYRKKRTLTPEALDALHRQYVLDAPLPALPRATSEQEEQQQQEEEEEAKKKKERKKKKREEGEGEEGVKKKKKKLVATGELVVL